MQPSPSNSGHRINGPLNDQNKRIMPESSTRKVSCIKRDIISEMPPNIQETILSYLPIRDAVRTSILSTKWRHCWTMIPQLIFDSQFLRSMRQKLSQYRRNSRLYAHQFLGVINKVLVLHKGPILKFYLRLLQGCDDQIIHFYIYKWIPVFSRKGVKQFTLDNSDCDEFTAHDFSSLAVTHLKLTRVRYSSTPALGEYTYLTNLEIKHAVDFSQSIFKCPVLEKLTLIRCKGLSPTNFHAPNLKCIYEISDQITLSGLENLTEYSFSLCDYSLTQRKSSNLVKVLTGLQKIEKFSIGMQFIKYLAEGGCPTKLFKSMTYLKTLNIFSIDFTKLSEVSCFLCLIRSSPNLCKLHISAVCRNYDAHERIFKNYWLEDSEDCTIDQLEIVVFSYFNCLRSELELVKFILAHSPSLKTMSIQYSGDVEKDAAVTVAKEMLKYSKASSRAQIRHSIKRATC